MRPRQNRHHQQQNHLRPKVEPDDEEGLCADSSAWDGVYEDVEGACDVTTSLGDDEFVDELDDDGLADVMNGQIGVALEG